MNWRVLGRATPPQPVVEKAHNGELLEESRPLHSVDLLVEVSNELQTFRRVGPRHHLHNAVEVLPKHHFLDADERAQITSQYHA